MFYDEISRHATIYCGNMVILRREELEKFAGENATKVRDALEQNEQHKHSSKQENPSAFTPAGWRDYF